MWDSQETAPMTIAHGAWRFWRILDSQETAPMTIAHWCRDVDSSVGGSLLVKYITARRSRP